jgi:hypothetical protein
MLSHRPEWLYTPGQGGDLAEVIARRLDDRRTGYAKPCTWSELADRLETILVAVSQKAHG